MSLRANYFCCSCYSVMGGKVPQRVWSFSFHCSEPNLSSKKHCCIGSPRNKIGRESERAQWVLRRTSRTSLQIKATCDKNTVFQPLPLCSLSRINGNRGQIPFASLFFLDLFWVLFPSFSLAKLLSFSGKSVESQHGVRIDILRVRGCTIRLYQSCSCD